MINNSFRVGLLTATATAMLLGVTPCAANRADSSAQHAVADADSFTRLVQLGNSKEALETRVVKLVPVSGSGPIIWLVSAAHIGEASYYKSIQSILNDQSLVLYEGVKKDEPAAGKPEKPFPNKAKSMYVAFANAVGLDFQLDDIDYSRKSFKNCDLTWDQVAKLSEQKGKQTKEMVSNIGKMLDVDSPQGKMVVAFLEQFKTDPAKKEAMRVALAEGLSTPGLMDKVLGEGTGDVLIQKRNAKVLTALNDESQQPSIAIFFGAAHMPNMEHRIENERHYRVAESLWFPAITADPSKVTGDGIFLLSSFRTLMGVKKG